MQHSWLNVTNKVENNIVKDAREILPTMHVSARDKEQASGRNTKQIWPDNNFICIY